MADRKLIVEVVGDSSSLERAFTKSTRASKVFGRELTGNLGKADLALQRLGAGRAALLGGALGAGGSIIGQKALTEMLEATNAASDLNEQVSKSRQVFGGASAAVEQWARGAAEEIGLAETAALTATGTFGNLFATVGIDSQRAAELSTTLAKLAGDLASFNNADPSEVLDAIRSGLIGEAEPLRRYGVLLSEARVQQLALQQTGKDSVKALTDQEKALARVSIILGDTSSAQGDFARTSDSLANKQRVLAAEAANLQANLGKLLLPAVTGITSALVDATGAANDLATALGKLGEINIPAIEIPFVAVQIPGTGAGLDQIAKEVFLQVNPVTGPFRRAKQAVDLIRSTEPRAGGRRGAGGVFDLTAALGLDDPRIQAGLRGASESGKAIIGSLDEIIESIKARARKTLEAGKAALSAKEAADRAEEEAERQRDAFEKLIASLTLRRDIAATTKGFQDDLASLTKIEQAVRARIKVEGRTAELERRLFDIARDRADIRRQIAEQQVEDQRRQREALQARQFRALGLTAEGGDVVPTVENLRKQLAQLSDRLGPDVSGKIKGQLGRAGAVLKGEFGKVTEQTREAIRDLFRTIRGTFDEEANKQLVRRVQISDKILRALGFGQAVQPRMPGRVSAPAGANVFNGDIYVVADNTEEMLRDLQKKAGRTTATARGRFPGRSLGLG